MSESVLVRYGVIHEVARFKYRLSEPAERGSHVVVQSHRGIELGALLESTRPCAEAVDLPQKAASDGPQTDDDTLRVLRRASREDEACQLELRASCEQQFDLWRRRIAEWKLQLELIDLEWTLDRAKLILYVLNDRGPECTKLALAAAAAGLGLIEVQPVTADGLLRVDVGSGGSGCGSGGCGCAPH